MELSVTALEICRKKLGLNELYGFDPAGADAAAELSQEAAERSFSELVREEWILTEDERIRVSALGQHILLMLTDPEQYLILDNAALRHVVRIYLRNGYYLFVLERKDAAEGGAEVPLTLRLLPGFKEVVGAFVYALLPDEGQTLAYETFRITAGARDAQGAVTSAVDIRGSYRGEKLVCEAAEGADGIRIAPEDAEMTVSALVNRLTAWMLDRVAETLAQKEDNHVAYDR